METFTIASDLTAPPEEVWAWVTTMTGINEELSPLRMTCPPSIRALRPGDVPLGRIWFRSWVLLWGLVPLDRHALCLTEIVDGEGFHEESTSWIERRWVHDRRIAARADGCRLTDQISFEPRVPALAPILRRIVRATFERRHRRLRERFGGLPAG